MGKKKEIKIKNKEAEVKKTIASLIKRENAKYLNDKSGDSLKQENKHFNMLVQYPKIIEEVWRDDIFLQTITIFQNCHFLCKLFSK